jgi:mRNA interferase MazF
MKLKILGGINMSTLGGLTNLSDAYNHEYDTREIKRGEIYYVDLEDIDVKNSHIANKIRPAAIFSNDIGNARSDIVTIALITSAEKRDYRFQYKFILNGTKSTLMCEQLLTVDQWRLKDKIGELTSEQMKEAENALMYELGLNKLSLENIVDFDIVSLTTRKTRTEEQTYFEARIEYEGNRFQTINVSLDKLKVFDSKITKDSEFTDIKKKLDNCRGLHWLVTNNEI